jgi:hypothetical protein
VYTVSTTHDTLHISSPILSIPQNGTEPLSYGLEQNYPNPFNPSTRIKYTVGGGGEAGAGGSQPASGLAGGLGTSKTSLIVYDLLGRQVAVLVNEAKGPGSYEASFDAGGLATGMYVYRLTTGAFVQSRKMLLIR